MAKQFEHLAPPQIQANMRAAQARFKRRKAQGRKPVLQTISGQPVKGRIKRIKPTAPILGVVSRGGGRRN